MNERVPMSGDREVDELLKPWTPLMFYIGYTIAPGGEVIEHELPCDLTAPTTLVISRASEIGTNFISIILHGEDRREWFVYTLVYLKFGFTK